MLFDGVEYLLRVRILISNTDHPPVYTGKDLSFQTLNLLLQMVYHLFFIYDILIVVKGRVHMDYKTQFIELYKQHIHREGSDKLLDYLMNQSDFFSAPASTRFHGSYPQGLVEHSLHVYECLKAYVERERCKDVYHMNYSDETIAIVALLHDICKIDCYKESTRNVKVNGSWTQVPYYEFEDHLPYGHGEKSVYIITGFMRLTREEAFAIRYHMGFSNNDDPRSVGYSFENFPLSFALSVADMESTYFLEKDSK